MTLLNNNPSTLVNDTLQQGILRYKGKVQVGKLETQRQQQILTIHSFRSGGHSRIITTYQRLKEIFQWHAMINNMKKIIQECEICQRCKNEHAYPGLLQPLSVPEKAWEHIYLWILLRACQSQKGKILSWSWQIYTVNMHPSLHWLILSLPHRLSGYL